MWEDHYNCINNTMVRGAKRQREADGEVLQISPKRIKTKNSRKSSKIKNATTPGDTDCKYSPKSLENLSLDFVSHNVDLLDTLVGLPEIIGKLIFDHIASYIACEDNYSSSKALHLFKVFNEAYREELLADLTFEGIFASQDLCSKRMFLDECSTFVESFTNLKRLDLSHCGPGNVDLMLDHIARMSSLEFLNLSGVDIDKEALRRLTISIKFYGRGLTNLKVLDLSFNRGIDHTCIDLISRFKTLEALHVTGTSIEVSHLKLLAEKLKLSPMSFSSPNAEEEAKRVFDFHVHWNKGWAADLLTKYLLKTTMKKELQKENSSLVWSFPKNFYKRPIKVPVPLEPLPTPTPKRNLVYMLLIREK